MQNLHAAPLPQQQQAGGAPKGDAPKMQIEKGSICWYRDSDGSAKKVEVIAVDRAIVPPSYVIRIEGRERETEVMCRSCVFFAHGCMHATRSHKGHAKSAAARALLAPTSGLPGALPRHPRTQHALIYTAMICREDRGFACS
jgi:hypothetical protein